MMQKTNTAEKKKAEAGMYNFASSAGGGAMTLPYRAERKACTLKQPVSNDGRSEKHKLPE